MTTITILYPNRDGVTFDFDYYVTRHMPRSIELLSAHPGFREVRVDRGLSGPAPGSKPEYVAICHFVFESAEAFLEAFMPNAPELQGDIPNYTNVEPVIQLSEVLIQKSGNRKEQ